MNAEAYAFIDPRGQPNHRENVPIGLTNPFRVFGFVHSARDQFRGWYGVFSLFHVREGELDGKHRVSK